VRVPEYDETGGREQAPHASQPAAGLPAVVDHRDREARQVELQRLLRAPGGHVRSVVVADDCAHRCVLGQLIQDLRRADITSMQDQVSPAQVRTDFRRAGPPPPRRMSIGQHDNAHPVILPGRVTATSLGLPSWQRYQAGNHGAWRRRDGTDEELTGRAPDHEPVPEDAADQVTERALAAVRPDRMPALYLGHGAPPLVDDPLRVVQLEAWASALPRPAAILVVSAHWEHAPLAIGATAHTAPLTYDFYGFAERYDHARYPAPGAPELARRVRSLQRSIQFA
jgi:hypothetical protein